MVVAIKLDKNIECEYICMQIQKLINDSQSIMGIGDSILVIDIKNIIDSSNPVPKLTYEDSPG